MAAITAQEAARLILTAVERASGGDRKVERLMLKELSASFGQFSHKTRKTGKK